MAAWTIDLSYDSDEDDFTQTNELDGVRFLLRFTWNDRDEAWRLSAYQPDGTPLALSRKIVLGASLFEGLSDERLPLGLLIAADTSLANVEAGHDDLGQRVVLFYFDAEEVAATLAA